MNLIFYRLICILKSIGAWLKIVSPICCAGRGGSTTGIGVYYMNLKCDPKCVYPFIISIIMETCVMAIFSMTALKDISEQRPVAGCKGYDRPHTGASALFQGDLLSLLPARGSTAQYLDTAISALVLVGLTNRCVMILRQFRRG